MRDDATRDDAAFPVLEAMLAATLIFATILFVTFIAHPTAPPAAAQDELPGIASGLARGLVDAQIGTEPRTPATSGTTVATASWLEVALDPTVAGDAARANVAAYIATQLPPGDHFVLRVHNGYGAIDVVADQGLPTPNAHAAVGSALVLPPWSDSSVVTAVAPGRTVTVPAMTNCYIAPNGQSTRPDGSPWGFAAGGPTPTPVVVPPEALYGVWKTGADCTSTTASFRVTPNGTGDADRLPMMLQVVVWHA